MIKQYLYLFFERKYKYFRKPSFIISFINIYYIFGCVSYRSYDIICSMEQYFITLLNCSKFVNSFLNDCS